MAERKSNNKNNKKKRFNGNSDEEEIKELINTGKATFYIGFDPTADSLHVGHFMALCLMKRLQMAGNKPVVLLGGGTGYIGDPSGRTDMRAMLSPETIQHNCECFKKLYGKISADALNKKAHLLPSSFDTFSLSYYKGDDYFTMERILNFTRNYAETFTPDSESIFMLGKTGLGKTHLSLAIANNEPSYLKNIFFTSSNVILPTSLQLSTSHHQLIQMYTLY